MTDRQKLRDAINRRGLKLSYVAKFMGMSRQTLSYRMNNHREFTASEIKKMCGLLGITDLDEREAIFFAPDVENNSANGEQE